MIEYDPEPPFGGIDWGQANGEMLVGTSDDQLADLEDALTDRPDFYQRLFG